MVYNKLKLEVNNFDLITSIYIYKKFKEGLDHDRVQYSHFAHYYHPIEEPIPTIRIKFDFITNVESEKQKGLCIAEELKSVENKIIGYNNWEIVDIEDWLILSHHLASECILILVENQNYFDLIKNLPNQRYGDFILSFFHLFMKKLFDVDLTIDEKYLSHFENGANNDLFNAYVKECKDMILSSSEEKVLFFAKPELNNGEVDFRERFIHFILNCSLTWNRKTEDIFYTELFRVLNCDNPRDLMSKICLLINKKKRRIWMLLIYTKFVNIMAMLNKLLLKRN